MARSDLGRGQRQRRPRTGIPPVIGGDFDAKPDSSSIRFLTGLQGLGGRSTF